MTEAAENKDNFSKTTDTKIEDKHTEQKLHNANQVKSNHQLAQAVAEISKWYHIFRLFTHNLHVAKSLPDFPTQENSLAKLVIFTW